MFQKLVSSVLTCLRLFLYRFFCFILSLLPSCWSFNYLTFGSFHLLGHNKLQLLSCVTVALMVSFITLFTLFFIWGFSSALLLSRAGLPYITCSWITSVFDLKHLLIFICIVLFSQLELHDSHCINTQNVFPAYYNSRIALRLQILNFGTLVKFTGGWLCGSNVCLYVLSAIFVYTTSNCAV